MFLLQSDLNYLYEHLTLHWITRAFGFYGYPYTQNIGSHNIVSKEYKKTMHIYEGRAGEVGACYLPTDGHFE